MAAGGRIALGAAMVVIGIVRLVTGSLGDDMLFLIHRPAPPGGSPNLHHWETDPVGYLMAAMIWGLVIAIGVVLIAQGLKRRRPQP